MARTRPLILSLAATGSLAAAALAATAYETPTTRAASKILPAELAASPDHRVVEQVPNDGLFDHYTIETKYGRFEALGRTMLQVRVQEAHALAELDRVSKTGVFLDAVKRSATAPIETVVEFADKPVETVKALPGGAKRLWDKYRYQAKELVDEGKEVLADDEKGGGGSGEKAITTDRAKQEAESYAKKYLGISAAERRWYAELGADPYTSNEVLAKAVKKISRVEAAASFGMRFVMPSIPGVHEVRKAMELAWKEDPVLLRKRNRELLAAAGATEEEIGRFEDNPALSPTRQLFLVETMRALDGVAGRRTLLERAIATESEDEGMQLVQAAGLLVWVHRNREPLAEVLGEARLPVARTRSGRLVVTAPFDDLRWTAEVAEAAERFARERASGGAAGRDLYLFGGVSKRAGEELARLGWKVHPDLQTEVARAAGG